MADSISERLSVELAREEDALNRQASVPAIPVPTEDISALTKSVRAIKTVLDQMVGAGGSVLDKAMTVRDMLQEGGLSYSQAYGLQSSAAMVTNVIGGGGSGGGTTVYVDPRPVLDTPPTPTGLTARGIFRSAIVSWTPPYYANHAYTEIWRDTQSNLALALSNPGNLIAQASANVYDDGTAVNSVTYYYWVRHVSTAGNPGAYSSVASGGPTVVGGADLGSLIVDATKLADGSVTAAKLMAGQIDATKFASSIEPITIIASGGVPTTKSTTQIFVASTGKLYRWNGSAYTASVIAADLDAQITSGQIADNAITAVKIAAGQVTAAKTAIAAIDASTGNLTANSVLAVNIKAGEVVAGKLATDAVVAANIKAGEVVAGKLAADAVLASNIKAGEIQTSHMTANSINGDRILANSLDAGKITAGSITASQIAAGAITTDRLLVTSRGAALNDDPACTDISAWENGGHGSTATKVTVADGVAGTSAFRSNAGDVGSSIQTAKFVAVNPNKKYRVSAWFRRSATATGVAYMRLIDTAGNQLTLSGGENIAPGTAWEKVSAEFTPGTSQQYVKIRLILNWAYSPGYQEVMDVRIEEKADADLIVDGAIVATKLAANAIAVGSAAIQNGAITNAMIADLAVDTAKIADAAIVNAKIGSLDASKITTGTLDANRIGANSIDVTKINANGLVVRALDGTPLFGAGYNMAYSLVNPDPGWLNSQITISPSGVLSNAGGGQVTLPGMGLNSYRVITAGASAAGSPVYGSSGWGIYKNGSFVSGVARSYTLVRIRRSDGAVVFVQSYDVYSATSAAAALAADLNATDNSNIVVVYSYDEPAGNRASSGLDSAMYRCGASRAVFGSPNFKYRSAYVLVGIPGCGEGNGAEAYQGSVDSDTNAWVDVSFQIKDGTLLGVSANYTPKSLQDYGYTGSLSATDGATFGVNISGTITPTTASTYIQDGAIGTAQIGSAAITLAKINTASITNLAALSADLGTVTAGTLSAVTLSAVTGSIGSITVGSGGHVKQGQTAWNTGTGFWLGDVSGTPKFSLGNPSGAYMAWDGTDLRINTPTFDAFSATISGTWPNYSANITGGKAPYQYVWSTQITSGPELGWVYIPIGITSSSCTLGFTASSFSGSGSGKVILLVKDANGRTTFASHDISFYSIGGGGGGSD